MCLYPSLPVPGVLQVQRLVKYLAASEVANESKAAVDGDLETHTGRYIRINYFHFSPEKLSPTPIHI